MTTAVRSLFFLCLLLGIGVQAAWAVDVCDVQAYDPETGLSPLEGTRVNVTGVVTVPPGIFQAAYTSMYIEGIGDDICGVNVFGFDRVQNVFLGDTVTVRGDVEEYISGSGYGAITEIFLSSTADVTVKSTGAIPEPEFLLTGQVGREENEGRLVRVKAKVASPVLGRNFTVDDGSGPIDVYDFGQNFTRDSTWQNLVLGDEITLTGVVSQSTQEVPYLNGYRILPRSPAPPYQDVTGEQCVPGGSSRALLEVSAAIFCPGMGEKVTITYNGPHEGRLKLRVIDAAGRTVATLDDRISLCGGVEVDWRGRNELMEMLPMGLYHIVATATDGQGIETQETVPIVIGRRLK